MKKLTDRNWTFAPRVAAMICAAAALSVMVSCEEEEFDDGIDETEDTFEEPIDETDDAIDDLDDDIGG